MTGSRHLHRIPALGLSVEIDRSRSLETYPLDDGAIVTQRLPGDAAVFVRYGTGQTLEHFVAGLGDLHTAATTLADEPVSVSGRPARRLTLSLRRRGKQTPGRSTHRPSRIEVTGLRIGDVPVLIGYRLPDESDADLGAAVERFVGSVDVSGPSPADDARECP